MNPTQAPLFDSLVSNKIKKPSRFHVPGHKGGQNLEREDEMNCFAQIMSIDFTEITGLDDLHCPEGVILEAQRLAADCFGAEESYFLVNGTTSGNLAAIMAVCNRNEVVIVQRDVHKSIINALMLTGATAVFLSLRVDYDTGLTAGIYINELEDALKKYPNAKAVVLSNPNYYGFGGDLTPIVMHVHKYDIPLIVDEAHGAHFSFHKEVPASAMACGADISIQSTHKMLTAMTMGAMLHVQGELVNRNRLKHFLTVVQSSSPSYPIMASLDITRRRMHIQGEESLTNGLAVITSFQEKMKQLPCYTMVTHLTDNMHAMIKDPFKIIIRDQTGTLSGYELQKELESDGCMVELADPQYVLLVFSLATTLQDISKLFDSLVLVCERYKLIQKEVQPKLTNYYIMPFADNKLLPISFDLLSNKTDKIVPSTIENAIGAKAAEMVIPYPPGVPVLLPGEKISEEMASYLQILKQSGVRFHGADSSTLSTIRIYME